MTSCHRKRVCPNGGMKLGFTAFDSISVDTVIVKSYKLNTNFTEFVDSTIIVVQKDCYLTDPNETIYIKYGNIENDEDDGFIETRYDLEIITPNHNYKITKFSVDIKIEKVGLISEPIHMSKSRISEYYLNEVQTINQPGNTLYLEK
jgi:hypothetical protein